MYRNIKLYYCVEDVMLYVGCAPMVIALRRLCQEG